MSKKRKNEPVEVVVARLEERMNSLEGRLFGEEGAFQGIRTQIERLEGRQWWLLGTVILTLLLTVLGIFLSLPKG